MSDFLVSYICHKLRIDNPAKIEIEAKKKLSPKSAQELREYFLRKKNIKHIKTSFFIDQFLDTQNFDIFHAGASLRLRYKKNGTVVYLQYKGHGFSHQGVLFRSEFSSGKIKGLVKEESLHDTIHFTEAIFREIMEKALTDEMRSAMLKHLGPSVVKKIKKAPVICFYKKEKFMSKFGNVYLEPSIDQLSAFHINENSFHSLSNFWEYENEIKSEKEDLQAKISKLDKLLEFDEEVGKKIKFYQEDMDKYHRIMSCFIKEKPDLSKDSQGMSLPL